MILMPTGLGFLQGNRQMKVLIIIFLLSLGFGIYFQPGPDINESDLHYILHGKETWQTIACSTVAAISIVAMYLVSINNKN